MKKDDPFLKVRNKMRDKTLRFSLKTVGPEEVSKIINKMKAKTSHGYDGISAEILKMGGKALIKPITAKINKSIRHPSGIHQQIKNPPNMNENQ